MRRKCSKCGKVKECRKNKTCKDGFQALCLTCSASDYKGWAEDPINHKNRLKYYKNWRKEHQE